MGLEDHMAVDDADVAAERYLAEIGENDDNAAARNTNVAVDAEEQYRAELETEAGAEPDTETLPDLESMEEDWKKAQKT